jgi:hypothetical protein
VAAWQGLARCIQEPAMAGWLPKGLAWVAYLIKESAVAGCSYEGLAWVSQIYRGISSHQWPASSPKAWPGLPDS